MSARDKIVAMFPNQGIGESVADEILNEHAHELAEKAAAEMSGCCQECDAATAIMRHVIAPEAQK